MVVLPRLGIEPNPDFPKNSPPRPSPTTPTPTPTATDTIIASITSSSSSSATSTSSSPAPTDNGSSSSGGGGGFIKVVAEDGTSGDKLLRGFLVGMAIGTLLSLVVCCWLPCFRKGRRRTRLQRRNDNIRRRLVILEDEAWVSENWPRRRPWDVGEDESGSHESHGSHEG
ncbi:hypothetical protein BBK36DRAFT_1169911 [Trichoderma citrinoviride]|uniref:Uncharacterized protein n=1 Tax=Trichoderma citrinoviride TaxID=58853 RepID=A0A2T4B744_9HYPO|nr:hypothetical protein BBK36DRAFT_1169911 [Trichoderma citrinoviride]PTB65145.1 hypothetical protein BBK36DRAFT_1169911 [Trichoderma citrinoviride]